jgi:hypothetical protein
MFTQFGLDNIWCEAKSGVFWSNGDVQIVADSEQERCIKIYLYFERRFAYFSSKRSCLQPNQPFSLWLRSSQWEYDSPVLQPNEAMNGLVQSL